MKLPIKILYQRLIILNFTSEEKPKMCFSFTFSLLGICWEKGYQIELSLF